MVFVMLFVMLFGIEMEGRVMVRWVRDLRVDEV